MLVRRYPRGFAFYLADPISSVHEFTPIAEWLSLAASNFVAIRAIRVQQIALQRKACCLLRQSAKTDVGLTKGACHQATIHLLCRMGHSAAMRLLLPLVTFAQGTAPSPAAIAERLHPLLTKQF